jgi:hypothetical protein
MFAHGERNLPSAYDGIFHDRQSIIKPRVNIDCTRKVTLNEKSFLLTTANTDNHARQTKRIKRALAAFIT